MRGIEVKDLCDFEGYLLNIAKRCEIKIGFNGLEGFLYESVKDQIKWANLSVKKYVGMVMAIGYYATMKKEDFDNIGSNRKDISEMSADDINKLAGV